jgi:hypothetical protein
VSLESCIVAGNWPSGAAVSVSAGQVQVTNCLITGNNGAGVSISWPGTTVVLRNSTIAGNRGGSWPAVYCIDPGTSADILNCIVWNNRDDSVCGELRYSTVGEDPLFVREGTFDFNRVQYIEVEGRELRIPDCIVEPGDYRLREGSPAIDAGTVEGAPDTDIEGVSRPCGGGVDQGAYERGGCGLVSVPFRRGDASADGSTDMTDAIFVLDYLFRGGRDPDCLDSADANDSGSIDISDAVFLLNYLFLGGSTPPPPREACGADETPSPRLSCQSFPPCED